MWTAASDLGKYLATLTIIFEILPMKQSDNRD